MTKKTIYQVLEMKDKEYIWHPFTHIKEWRKENIIIIKKGGGHI